MSMKKCLSYLFSGSMTVLLFCISGCNDTPFAPISVPEATSIRPDLVVKKADSAVELQKLHNITVPAYRLMPGDIFAFSIPDRADLSRSSVQLMSDGTVSISPIGHIKLSGLTIPEASQLLSRKYQKFVRDCEIILEPVKIRPASVTIVGAVSKPGIYPITIGMTRISDAMTLAGGVLSTMTDDNEPLQLSDLDGAYIVRDGKILPVDFTKAVTKGNMLHNIPVMNNDYIYVPSLENSRITVLGEVNSQDSVIYQPDLTVLQAIGKVGGLKDTKSAVIKVIRGGLKHPVVYNLNIKDMQMGKIADFTLRPADIVYVPKKPISEWNVIVRDIMVTLGMLNSLAGPFGSPVQFYDD